MPFDPQNNCFIYSYCSQIFQIRNHNYNCGNHMEYVFTNGVRDLENAISDDLETSSYPPQYLSRSYGFGMMQCNEVGFCLEPWN